MTYIPVRSGSNPPPRNGLVRDTYMYAGADVQCGSGPSIDDYDFDDYGTPQVRARTSRARVAAAE